jgi:hypothetical protein
MRYLINMDYSFDLNINTMGRRIRTRLYFSSESHLHTILNVRRFTKSADNRSLLSDEGKALLNATPELCYLTQFVMRVFEDSRRDMSDPKRFRVEMLFSPGATATPFHVNELDRDADASRFDTAPFENIGRDDLTCQDVEDFFARAIMAGRSVDNEDDEDRYSEISTAFEKPLSPMKGNAIKKTTASPPSQTDAAAGVSVTKNADLSEPPAIVKVTSKGAATSAIPEPSRVAKQSPAKSSVPQPAGISGSLSSDDVGSKVKADGNASNPIASHSELSAEPKAASADADDDGDGDEKDEAPPSDSVSSKLVSRRYLWSGVAIGCFTLGAACLMTALHMSHGTKRRRHWTSKR